MSASRRVVPLARLVTAHSAGRDGLPWRSGQELTDATALGRQVITLMTAGCLIAAGHISGHLELGYAGAWHAFETGAHWVGAIDGSQLPDES